MLEGVTQAATAYWDEAETLRISLRIHLLTTLSRSITQIQRVLGLSLALHEGWLSNCLTEVPICWLT